MPVLLNFGVTSAYRNLYMAPPRSEAVGFRVSGLWLNGIQTLLKFRGRQTSVDIPKMRESH